MVVIIRRYVFDDDNVQSLRAWHQSRYGEKPPGDRKLCELFIDSAEDNQWLSVQDELNKAPGVSRSSRVTEE